MRRVRESMAAGIRARGFGPEAADGDHGQAEPDVLDARLLPAAVCCWGATIAALTGGWALGIAVGVVVAGLVVGVGISGRWTGSDRWRYRREHGRWHEASELWVGVDRRRSVAAVVLASMLLGSGFAVATAWREHRVQTHPLRAAVGSSVRVVVTPEDDPKAVRGSSFGGQRLWMVRAGLAEFRRGDVTYRAGGSVVILGGGDDWKRVLPGQRIEFRARVESPRHRDLTVAALHALGSPRPVGTLPWWQRAAAHARSDLVDAAAEALPAAPAGLLPALVVGDTSALHESVRTDFELAGLQHLTVVSGANFTIVLSVVLLVVRLLTLGPRPSAAIAAVTLLMFVVIARPDPSVLRAGAMGAITLLALVTGRRKQALPALCAAVIGLLAFWPELAVSAGFALSVLATAALILLAPSWADWLCARGWWRLPAELVAVSAGAFVVTVPIMVALSGRVSLVAILANILVAPVVALITVIGAVGAATASCWPSLAEIVLRAAGPPLWWLLAVAERSAALPGATVVVPGGSAGGFLAAALVTALVCGLRSAPLRKLIGVIVLGCAVILIPVRIRHPGWPPSDWILAACDVGQGDALALSLGDGTAIVIDVGPDPRTVGACLDRLRVERIALLVLTHPHADHIAGLNGALHGRSVAAIAVAPHELDAPVTDSPRRAATPTGDDVASPGRDAASPGRDAASERDTRGVVEDAARVGAVAARAAITVLELSAGQLLDFGEVRLEVLAPVASAQPRARGAEGANDRSLVIAASTPVGRILLTGDIEAPAQHRLLVRDADAVRADILKVPHHGSRTTTKEFLAAVRPRLAVVSVGAENTFGHPNPEILAELENLGATVVRTDRDGDILVVGSASSPGVMTSRRSAIGAAVRQHRGDRGHVPDRPRWIGAALPNAARWSRDTSHRTGDRHRAGRVRRPTRNRHDGRNRHSPRWSFPGG
ncbi:ComEC/Rec2 family competence protein [Nocardia sp. NPDC005366]|uniref:ComEC/Rec2 family competence protein n=1 Tax=Nocardia sp. NPDC005366 TaxID=3156878 RepID=UPI0033B9614A